MLGCLPPEVIEGLSGYTNEGLVGMEGGREEAGEGGQRVYWGLAVSCCSVCVCVCVCALCVYVQAYMRVCICVCAYLCVCVCEWGGGGGGRGGRVVTVEMTEGWPCLQAKVFIAGKEWCDVSGY